MEKVLRIGTRESRLAVWQAECVKDLLAAHHITAELVCIKSEGDVDLETPLYEMGVQGIFTRSLDIALLNNKIDLAVHSMKDVPVQLAQGIVLCAVLKRGPVNDLLVYKDNDAFLKSANSNANIATSSIRRKAQWLHKYPLHTIHNLRGNVNTRLNKLATENWNAAIFAQAGLERINIRPTNSIVLDWMLPAPAQGAIMVVCRDADQFSFQCHQYLNDADTALCTKMERDFLKTLLGGCSTPISAFAEIEHNEIYFRGNLLSLDGKQKVEVEKILPVENAENLGKIAAEELLLNGGREIAEGISTKHAG